MASKPITEDPDMDPVIRAVALFCASIVTTASVSSSASVLEQAEKFEDYIRTGSTPKRAKEKR